MKKFVPPRDAKFAKHMEAANDYLVLPQARRDAADVVAGQGVDVIQIALLEAGFHGKGKLLPATELNTATRLVATKAEEYVRPLKPQEKSDLYLRSSYLMTMAKVPLRQTDWITLRALAAEAQAVPLDASIGRPRRRSAVQPNP